MEFLILLVFDNLLQILILFLFLFVTDIQSEYGTPVNLISCYLLAVYIFSGVTSTFLCFLIF